MFDEETLEKITMEMLEELGYIRVNGYEMKRADYSSVILEEDLFETIRKLNTINHDQAKEVIRLIRNLEHNNTILNNKQFTEYLLNGVPIPYQ